MAFLSFRCTIRLQCGHRVEWVSECVRRPAVIRMQKGLSVRTVTANSPFLILTTAHLTPSKQPTNLSVFWLPPLWWNVSKNCLEAELFSHTEVRDVLRYSCPYTRPDVTSMKRKKRREHKVNCTKN